MARLSNISVVVPLPSFDIDPLKTFDEDFFDRAVDNILSETSVEESRDDMMDNNIGISCPLGYDGAFDSSKLSVRRNQRTGANSPHFSTTSTSSLTTTSAKKPKSRRSSEIRKSVTMEDASDPGEASMSLENITQPQGENEGLQVEPHPIHEVGDHPSTVPEIPDSAAMPTGDNEMTAEEKIFASVDPEKQIEVLKFVVSHSFMTEQVQHVRRSARREFTGQVRGAAAKAGMDEIAIAALVDHVRKIYLEDRGIMVADDSGSAFGDEVDDEEETHIKSSHRKRRNSSSDQPEDKERKKSKRRHSDKARQHSHDAMQHDEPTKVVETLAGVLTKGQGNGYVEREEPTHKDNTPDLPKMPTNIIRGSPSTPIDLTDSASLREFAREADVVPSRTQKHDVIREIKGLQGSSGKVITHLSPDAPMEMVRSPSPEQAVGRRPSKRREPKVSQRDKNKRKRERRRERNRNRKQHAQGDSVDRADQDSIPPSIPQETPSDSPNGGRRGSNQLPLPANPSEWTVDF
ncbi:hypothetical protein ACN38_g2238 [Penicillium nordicum]|uniref:Uncharacterized protein n=1 Tax=Penicillium nordicum TaxID=229535 RepID=A0A0M9WJ60_9EURO|nr:hypothetical protein ACN38_g2238 [Penicillium nordicum]